MRTGAALVLFGTIGYTIGTCPRQDETEINYYKVCSEFNNAVQSCTY